MSQYSETRTLELRPTWNARAASMCVTAIQGRTISVAFTESQTNHAGRTFLTPADARWLRGALKRAEEFQRG